MITDNNKIKILFSGKNENWEKDPFVIIEKPANLPSAPLVLEDENTALSQLVQFYPELSKVIGKKKCEYGLLHRLDTQTRGCLLVAATQKAYDTFQEHQNSGKFIKEYIAVCSNNNMKGNSSCSIDQLDGFPIFPNSYDISNCNEKHFIIESFFRAYGKGRCCVRPVTSSSGKAAIKKSGKKKYVTEIKSVQLSSQNQRILCAKRIPKGNWFLCSITNGYRHQVRCHLAWSGNPVLGDVLYNPNYICDNNSSNLYFFATSLCFPHPLTGEPISFSLLPQDKMTL